MGTVGIPSFPGRSGSVAGSLCGSPLPEPTSFTGGLVGDCRLAFRLNTFPCLLLLVQHVKDQMGRLYFGEVKFLFGMAFPQFQSSFDGSAGFWQIGIRRIPVVGKIDSWYVWWEQGPFGTDQRDSIRKVGGVYCLSDILLTGGQ